MVLEIFNKNLINIIEHVKNEINRDIQENTAAEERAPSNHPSPYNNIPSLQPFVFVSGLVTSFPSFCLFFCRIGPSTMVLLPPTRSWTIGWTCWSWSSGRSPAAASLSTVWQDWGGEHSLPQRLGCHVLIHQSTINLFCLWQKLLIYSWKNSQTWGVLLWI